MENYKKSLKTKNFWMILIIIFIFAIYLILLINKKFIDEYDLGFSLGVFTGLSVEILFFITRNLLTLRNEDKLRRLYIKEHDERSLMIKQKTGSIGIQICMIGLGIASLVSIFFDKTVFYSLFAALFFIAIVKAILKIYYMKKF